jgi:membrane protease YdiL (CAAX protease family)
MNRKIVVHFLALTFLIAIVTCGISTALGLLFDLTIENAGWIWVFIALCAFSPTIASYVVLKTNKEVKGLKEWLKNVFGWKGPKGFFLFVIILCVIDTVPKIIISGLDEAQPFYMFFVFIPVALVGGGIEEAGWSYVLRPELGKRFGLVSSSLIVGLIWIVWHIPVFLPQGRIESLPWFLLFALGIIGESFALGAIVKITKSVFLCVLFHTLINAASMTFGADDTFLGSALTTCLLIVVSISTVYFHEKKRKAV